MLCINVKQKIKNTYTQYINSILMYYIDNYMDKYGFSIMKILKYILQKSKLQKYRYLVIIEIKITRDSVKFEL